MLKIQNRSNEPLMWEGKTTPCSPQKITSQFKKRAYSDVVKPLFFYKDVSVDEIRRLKEKCEEVYIRGICERTYGEIDEEHTICRACFDTEHYHAYDGQAQCEGKGYTDEKLFEVKPFLLHSRFRLFNFNSLEWNQAATYRDVVLIGEDATLSCAISVLIEKNIFPNVAASLIEMGGDETAALLAPKKNVASLREFMDLPAAEQSDAPFVRALRERWNAARTIQIFCCARLFFKPGCRGYKKAKKRFESAAKRFRASIQAS